MHDAMASEWLERDGKYKRLMLILMQNLRKPCMLKVLKIFNVNLETFQRVNRLLVASDMNFSLIEP